MPRNVRNFWIELDVDGRKSRIAAGPRQKNGGFFCVVYMREDGAVKNAVSLEGRVSPDGDLLALRVSSGGKYGLVLQRNTRR